MKRSGKGPPFHGDLSDAGFHPRIFRRAGQIRDTSLALAAETDVARLFEATSAGVPVSFAHVLLLGLETFDVSVLIARVEAGLPFSVYERFAGNLELPQDRVLEILSIPRRTLVRRKDEGRLSPSESDRLLRVSRIVAEAITLFEGDRDAAVRWLESSQLALGGGTPFDFVRSELGGREVEALIGRLEHGVFS